MSWTAPPEDLSRLRSDGSALLATTAPGSRLRPVLSRAVVVSFWRTSRVARQAGFERAVVSRPLCRRRTDVCASTWAQAQSSSSKRQGIRIQRCMRIVGCAGPLQKGHRSTRSTHAPQTAWPQSTNAIDLEAEQHSAHWDAVAAARASTLTGAAPRRPGAGCARPTR